MAKAIGALRVELSANHARFENDMRRAKNAVKREGTAMSRHMETVEGSFDGAVKSMLSLRTVAATLGAYGMGQIVKGAIDVASSFERMQIKLDQVSGGKGKELLEELNAWALKMPINTEKTVDSFVLLTAMGLEPTRKTMETLVDVGSVFGDDVLGRLALQLGQASAKGKMMAQDLNVMAEAGINARGYLREAFGMSLNDLQKSTIPVQKQIQAIFDGMEKDFGGTARRMMGSWSGLTETMRSYIVEVARSVMDGGAFGELKGIVGDINGVMDDWLEKNKQLQSQGLPNDIDAIGSSVAFVVATISDAIQGFGIMGRSIVELSKWASALTGGGAQSGMQALEDRYNDALKKRVDLTGDLSRVQNKLDRGRMEGKDLVKAHMRREKLKADIKQNEVYIDRLREAMALDYKFRDGAKPEEIKPSPIRQKPPATPYVVKEDDDVVKEREEEEKRINDLFLEGRVNEVKIAQEYVDAQRDIYIDLTDKKNSLVMDEYEYRRWALDAELEDMRANARDSALVLDAIAAYREKALEKIGKDEAEAFLSSFKFEEASQDIEEEIDRLGDTVKGWADSSADAIANFATGAEFSFSSMVDSMVQDLVRLMVYQSITKPLFEGVASSLGGSLFGGGRATGGPVSAGAMYEVNERGVPEILSVGNRQFLMMANQDGMVAPLGAASSGGGMAGGVAGETVVNVNNYSSESIGTKTSTGANGQKQIDIMVGAAVARDIASNGPAARAMQRTWGSSRRGRTS